MKENLKITTFCALAFFGMTAVPFGQPKVPVSTKEFMREKLERSQKLLGALTTEDYFTLGQLAQRLSAMTQEAGWQAFQNPDYTQFSANFRTQANALSKAAKEKNVDAATLAYVRMTMSCVDCHKFVRGRLLGGMPLDLQQFARK
jgi:hypothetical protein